MRTHDMPNVATSSHVVHVKSQPRICMVAGQVQRVFKHIPIFLSLWYKQEVALHNLNIYITRKVHKKDNAT